MISLAGSNPALSAFLFQLFDWLEPIVVHPAAKAGIATPIVVSIISDIVHVPAPTQGGFPHGSGPSLSPFFNVTHVAFSEFLGLLLTLA